MKPTALITGASRGLGRALAEHLAHRGFRLVLTARGAEPLRVVAGGLRTYTDVVDLAGDVRDAAHRSALADAARDGLDILVNNASSLGPTPLPPVVEVSPHEWHAVLDTNLVAPIALVAATLPALRAREGLVVNVTSDAAIGGYPGWGAYGASKAALELAGRTLAAELDGVAVVTVDPGDMQTQMHQDAHPGEDISDRPGPEETLPFWAWLFGATRSEVAGQRFAAQDDVWRTATSARESVTP